MTLNFLFTVHSVIAFANVAIMLVFPAQYMGFFGVEVTGAGTAFLVRIFAAALLTYGFVGWFARNAGPSEAMRAIILGFFLSIAVGFFVVLHAQLSGVLNIYGWALVALYFLIGFDYGYTYFQHSAQVVPAAGSAAGSRKKNRKR
jgi:hypothetical protein